MFILQAAFCEASQLEWKATTTHHVNRGAQTQAHVHSGVIKWPPTRGQILELVAGLLLPPLPGLEQLSQRGELAALLSRAVGILDVGGAAVQRHFAAGQRRRLLQAIDCRATAEKVQLKRGPVQSYLHLVVSTVGTCHETIAKPSHTGVQQEQSLANSASKLS